MRVPIADRPKRVDPRREFGHFESDTAVGASPSRRRIDTQAERKRRRPFARFIEDSRRPPVPNTTSTRTSPRPR